MIKSGNKKISDVSKLLDQPRYSVKHFQFAT